MFLCRYVIFELQESSKYYVATGRDEDAMQVRALHIFRTLLYT